MIKNKYKKIIKILNHQKIIYFLNINKLNSEFLFKLKNIFFKKNIFLKVIKNSIFKKYINNKKLLIKNIIKYNLTILIFKKKNIDNINAPLKIINKFKKKYNLKYPIIKSVFIKNKVYYKKKHIIDIINIKDKKYLILKLLNFTLFFNKLIFILKYYNNIYYILNKIKNVKKN
ncbi:MAG: hypothetical protein ABUS76_00495 [Candidatus Shikimatogenerans sp. Ttur]|uniref:50S ribosomal protein L10 n=1 Tax=Candidatus Shikimatogenerans sp. Ttur TaxID=3158569 RepID=A0AAU7ZYC3_9FLAO